jgi:hypothetical protein
MMTKTFATIASTVGLTCGLIACGSAESTSTQPVDPNASPAAPQTAPTAPAGAGAPAPATSAGSTAGGVTTGALPTTSTAPTTAAPGVQTPTAPTTPASPQTDPAAQTPTTPATPATPTATGELDHTMDVRGNCNLKTTFEDDKACVPAPKPGEGIQIHIGPSNYDDPAEVAKFIMKPGEESSECFTIRTPNTEKITYQTFMISGRAGTHHMINTIYSGDMPTGSFGQCGGFAADPENPDAPAPIGSLPGASKAYMPRTKVAPEYAHVGRELPANALMQGDMHYFNFTDKDILREVWVNLYFPPAEAKITEFSDQLRGFGGLGWNWEPIQPGTDMVYKYECPPLTSKGRIMNLLGHYHAHGKRFTASIKRASGMIEKVFEMYDYLDPKDYDYNSITTNPMFGPNVSGAHSGILEVGVGDVLQWECHIINDSMAPLAYTNEVKTGEMCNIWGYSVGTDAPIGCDLP